MGHGHPVTKLKSPDINWYILFQVCQLLSWQHSMKKILMSKLVKSVKLVNMVIITRDLKTPLKK